MSSFNVLVDDPTLPLFKEVEMKELLPNKCKNCRFWERYGKLRIGACESGFIRYCGLPDAKVPIAGVGYCDDENYKASIKFDQDFGCINYKIRRRP